VNNNGHISATEAAQILGKSKRRVNQLVADGELAAQRIGNANVIERASVEKYAAKHQRRPAGRKGGR
jgi:excisionase family DNA binding protein